MYCVCIEDTQHSINTSQASRLLGLSVLWFFLGDKTKGSRRRKKRTQTNICAIVFCSHWLRCYFCSIVFAFLVSALLYLALWSLHLGKRSLGYLFCCMFWLWILPFGFFFRSLSAVEYFVIVPHAEFLQYQILKQSTLVILRSKELSEILRDIRTSTY